jgi:hypothetical protein
MNFTAFNTELQGAVWRRHAGRQRSSGGSMLGCSSRYWDEYRHGPPRRWPFESTVLMHSVESVSAHPDHFQLLYYLINSMEPSPT